MGALSGIRVLDLTNVLSGPFCTLHLALLGAEVIKIENPKDGDLARKLGNVPKLNQKLMGTSFLAQNANKKSLTLNLKRPRGAEIFKRLVAGADVVVENFRPDVMARLGLGYEVLAEINPRLVYCGISGFGQSGPDADKPAYDQIIQGLSGVMDVNGDERLHPLRSGFPVCDTVGGLNAAFAILAALYHRERTGEGQFDRRRAARLDHAADGLGGRQPADRRPAAGADGQRQLHRRALRHLRDRRRLHQHRRQQAGAVGGARPRCWASPELKSDPRFQERDERKKNRAALTPLLEAKLRRAADRATGSRRSTRATCRRAPSCRWARALEQPQVRHREVLRPVAVEGIGEIPLFGPHRQARAARRARSRRRRRAWARTPTSAGRARPRRRGDRGPAREGRRLRRRRASREERPWA